MVKGLASIAPLALVVAAFSGATAYAISHDMSIGTWLLAGFLVGHGWVHIAFVVSAAATGAGTQAAAVGRGNPAVANPFDLRNSWLVASGVDPRALRVLTIGITAMTIIGFTLAGLATVGWLVPADWWPALVTASAVLSIAGLVIALSPMLAIGFAVDAGLIWIAVASIWTPAGSPLPG